MKPFVHSSLSLIIFKLQAKVLISMSEKQENERRLTSHITNAWTAKYPDEFRRRSSVIRYRDDASTYQPLSSSQPTSLSHTYHRLTSSMNIPYLPLPSQIHQPDCSPRYHQKRRRCDVCSCCLIQSSETIPRQSMQNHLEQRDKGQLK